MQRSKTMSCLVTVKYDGEVESLFVDCVEGSKGKFLLFPLQKFPRHLTDYPTGICSIRLRPQDVRESGHPEFDLKYIFVLDLDDELKRE